MGQVSRTLGKSGEYLAMYDITSQGYECFEINGDLCFDLGIMDDGKVYRVQVKSTSKKRTKDKHQVAMVVPDEEG